jgi:hypothetical protein
MARRRARAAAAAAAAMALAACATAPARPEVAAVVPNPTAESRAELARTVSRALHGAPVTLADDALTRDGTLVVERAPARDPEGRRLDGRAPGGPERFRLVMQGRRCVLVHEGSGRRAWLRSATCSPAGRTRSG